MQSIQEQVVQNYQDNIEYFEQNHESLFHKIKALETVLDDGRYPQKYDLEYKNGYFDVTELVNENFLYNQDSNRLSKAVADAVNFKKNEHVFETFYNYKFSEKALKKTKETNSLIMYANSAQIIDYHDKNTKKSDTLTKITKFIFIGLGLGLHIEPILHKTGADSLLLIEKDLELFRLSMFVINYKTILQNKKAFFSIGENQHEFKRTFDTFYLDAFVRNHYIKYSLFSDAYSDVIKNIQNAIISRPEKVYPHEFLLNKNIRVLNKISDNYNFLNLKTTQNATILKEKPLLLLGAGPSLSTNSEWLRQNADEFIIIAAFATLKTLKELAIKPDIVTQMDEKDIATQEMLDKFDDLSFLEDSLFVFSASVPDILIKKFSKEQIFLLEDRTNYITKNPKIPAASVGEFSYAVALSLNPSDIYLLGLDFALKDDGATHAKEHHRSKNLDVTKANEVQESISLDKSTLEIKGNFRQKVFSTPLLAMSVPMMDNYTSALKKESQKVYNLNDGAFLQGTIPLKPQDFSKKGTFNIDTQELLNFLQSHAQTTLNQNDIATIKSRKDQIKNLKNFLEFFNSSASLDRDSFLSNYTTLLNNIFVSKESELKEVLITYILNTATYIVDLFATKELNNDKKHTKKMKKIIYMEFKNIIEIYEDALKEEA